MGFRPNIGFFWIIRIFELHVDGGISAFVVFDEGDGVEVVIFALVVEGVGDFVEEMLIFFEFFVVGVGFEEGVVDGDRYFFVLVGDDVDFVFQHGVLVFLTAFFFCPKSIFKILLPLF